MAHGQPGPGLDSKDGSPVELLPLQGQQLLLVLDPQALSELQQINQSLQTIQILLTALASR